MNDVHLLDATPDGTVLFELTIDDKYSNLNGRFFSRLSQNVISPTYILCIYNRN
jgi:hypothetical protein